MTGPTPLRPTELVIPNLHTSRGSIPRGTLAEGTSTLSNVHYLQRGYEDIPGKLEALGSKLEVLTTASNP